jgi:hypothetical protein
MSEPIITRRYRLKWRHLIPRIIFIATPIALLLLAVYGVVTITRTIFADFTPASLLLVIPIPILLLVIYSQVMLLIFRIGNLFATYVDITPDGLEVRFWPLLHVVLRWPGIEKSVITRRFGRNTRMLNLETAEVLPESAFTLWYWQVFKPLKRFAINSRQPLLLDVIDGYPEGDFANHLRQVAPQLFASSDQ